MGGRIEFGACLGETIAVAVVGFVDAGNGNGKGEIYCICDNISYHIREEIKHLSFLSPEESVAVVKNDQEVMVLLWNVFTWRGYSNYDIKLSVFCFETSKFVFFYYYFSISDE